MRVTSVARVAIAGALLASPSADGIASGPPAQQNTTRPNIVLMMSDDQGWEETGYNGHPVMKTPVLDRLAAEGLRFDRFYSAAPNCGPTRGSIMTGRSSNRYGLFWPNDAIRPEEVTIAQILQKAGYATGHFGKWHLGPVKADAPNNPGQLGFDEWLAHDNYFEIDPPLSRNGAAPRTVSGESSMLVVDEALQFITKSQQAGKPFFTTVWFGSPHSPYVSLPEDEALYGQVENPALRRRFAEITAMDRAVGHFREELRRLGLRDNTMFWFQSDNGIPADGLYRPTLRGAKQTLFENGIRVPAVLEWPAWILRPRTTSVPFVTHDIMPTILDFVGLPIPSNRPIDGISMRALIEGSMIERPKPVGGFWVYPRERDVKNEPWLSPELLQGNTPNATNPNGVKFYAFKHPVARTSDFGGTAVWMANDFKLFVPADTQPQLYDIPNDPRETTDLAASRPEVLARLLKDLHTWQRSVEISLTGADYGR